MPPLLYRPTLAALVLIVLSGAVAAQTGPGRREGDVDFDRPGLTDVLSGRVIEFHDGSKATYLEDGGYSYTYRDDDPPFVGVWAAGLDGEVCVTFDNGAARCDTYVAHDGRLVLIVANGDRYPVRAVAQVD